MQILRTQFEIRYTSILDFSTRYKAIISPYLKLASFKIENFSLPEEYCVLVFKDDQSVIDIRWDRIIFRINTQTSLFEKRGPTAAYFEILKKLMSLDSFGEILNIFLALWVLNEGVSQAEFLDKYLKRRTNVGGFQLDDVAIVEEFKGASDEHIRIEHGFFTPEKDLAKYGIADPDGSLKTKKGQFLQLTIVTKKVEPTVEDFKNLHERIENLYKSEFLK